MNKQQLILCDAFEKDLTDLVASISYDKLFILADTYTAQHCLPLIATCPFASEMHLIVTPAGDDHKTLDALAAIWTEFSNRGASRHSLLLNLGGGMITDMGGFAAATFKRGFQYINIPTTLLGMVDAAVGGKTGINFNGLKNEVGVFEPAHTVLLETRFLESLDTQNRLSGYAEMLKHGLISDLKYWNELLAADILNPDWAVLRTLIWRSVLIKNEIVEQDPTEKGVRKALNLGHTVGHAFESFALETHKPILHGYAVAWGVVCELYLSFMKVEFPKETLRQYITYVKENYGVFEIECAQYDRIIELMVHDKKNSGGVINFTLLRDIGQLQLDQKASKEEIYEMLDFFRECMG